MLPQNIKKFEQNQKKTYFLLLIGVLFDTGSGTFSSRFSLDELLNSCKHFMRLVSLSSVHLKRACEVAIFVLET